MFRKRGARVNLRLDIAPIVTDLVDQSPQYQFNQRIIDKRDAVAIVPDDVYVSPGFVGVLQRPGWHPLAVTGSRNPFSCRQEGELEVVFDVPADLSETEVNAESGWYIRARVVHVENEFSMTPRWVVPFLKGAGCVWAYDAGVPVDACTAENNGETVELTDVSQVERLPLSRPWWGWRSTRGPCISGLTAPPTPCPWSLFFDTAGRVQLEDKLRFEAWTGQRF